MNLTEKRATLKKIYFPFGLLLYKLNFPPNLITFLSLVCGTLSALAYYYENLLTALGFFVLSGLLDLADGEVARLSERTTKFGAVFDWIADKWVDGLVLGITGYLYGGPAISVILVTASMLHSFIKPVVYSEIGFKTKIKGKIQDPLESVGFFGRPETHLTLIFFTLMQKISPKIGLAFGIKVITLLTLLSLLSRILYLYKNFGSVKDG